MRRSRTHPSPLGFALAARLRLAGVGAGDEGEQLARRSAAHCRSPTYPSRGVPSARSGARYRRQRGATRSTARRRFAGTPPTFLRGAVGSLGRAVQETKGSNSLHGPGGTQERAIGRPRVVCCGLGSEATGYFAWGRRRAARRSRTDGPIGTLPFDCSNHPGNPPPRNQTNRTDNPIGTPPVRLQQSPRQPAAAQPDEAERTARSGRSRSTPATTPASRRRAARRSRAERGGRGFAATGPP